MYNFWFFGQIYFCKHLYYITGFCDKKFNFFKFAIFFADSKSRAQELSNDVSFVIFGHKTWDLEGGSNWPPPQHILVFKYPSRDRVKQLYVSREEDFIQHLNHHIYKVFGRLYSLILCEWPCILYNYAKQIHGI